MRKIEGIFCISFSWIWFRFSFYYKITNKNLFIDAVFIIKEDFH